VKDAPVDGFSVVLENTSRSKEERMDEWKLKRRVDGKHDVVFTFPRDFILKPGKSVTVCFYFIS
jgi:intermediate filament protein if